MHQKLKWKRKPPTMLRVRRKKGLYTPQGHKVMIYRKGKKHRVFVDSVTGQILLFNPIAPTSPIPSFQEWYKSGMWNDGSRREYDAKVESLKRGEITSIFKQAPANILAQGFLASGIGGNQFTDYSKLTLDTGENLQDYLTKSKAKYQEQIAAALPYELATARAAGQIPQEEEEYVDDSEYDDSEYVDDSEYDDSDYVEE